MVKETRLDGLSASAGSPDDGLWAAVATGPCVLLEAADAEDIALLDGRLGGALAAGRIAAMGGPEASFGPGAPARASDGARPDGPALLIDARTEERGRKVYVLAPSADMADWLAAQGAERGDGPDAEPEDAEQED